MSIFPRWPVTESPSDTRKWVALLASFGGAIVFTVGAGLLVWVIWKGGWSPERQEQQLQILGVALFMVLGGSLAGILGFGFVMGRRSFKISKDGVELEGGEG